MSKYLDGIQRGAEQTSSRDVRGVSPKQSDYPVSAELAGRINAMHDALRREFGVDCAFTIMGAGNLIAASNYYHGRVEPTEGK